MKKRWMAFVLTFMLLVSCIVGCSGQSPSGSDAESGGDSGEKTKVVCYTLVSSTTSQEEIWNSIKEKFADKYEIELLEVDTENIDTIIKTGVASGEPADIYFRQAQYMKTYVDAGQALDLTPYLTENDNEWLDSLDPSLMEVGKYDDKYYSIPMTGVYGNFYVNKPMLEEAGIEIPAEWTWEQFLDVCAQIKEKTDAYPFAVCGLCNDFMARNALLSLSNDMGTMEQWGAGEISAMEPPLREALEQTKDLYDRGYWYPDEGAMITTRDEVVAAFHQEKVAIIADVNSISSMVADGCEFEVGIAAWPKSGSENISLGGADAYFIPSNAAHPDAAVEILKEFTSEAMQQIHADNGYAPVNVNVTSSDPIVQQFADLNTRIYGTELMYISSEMSLFWQDVLIEDYCLGTASLDDLLEQIEELRLEAVEE